jgi:hypothetical protein
MGAMIELVLNHPLYGDTLRVTRELAQKLECPI